MPQDSRNEDALPITASPTLARSGISADQLKGKAATADSAEELDALATAAESVISIENQGWMAKLAEEPPEQQATAG
jgi:hypothetical protein